MRLVGAAILVAALGALVAPRRYQLLLWIAVILAAVVPWTGFQPHSHWARVGWWPFLSPPVRLRDLVLNLLLYMPFGVFFVRQFPRRGWAVVGALVAGCCLSLATEATQVYSHGRFPTMTDVVMNSAGALVGGVAARMLSRFPRDVT